MKALDKIDMIKNQYIPLVDGFLKDNSDPEMFVRRYIALMTEDPTLSPRQEIFEVLQAIFEDAISYDPEPDPAHGAAEIDEEELRACCRKNLEKLKQIVETDG